jgi:anti-sigma B factor antagonist
MLKSPRRSITWSAPGAFIVRPERPLEFQCRHLRRSTLYYDRKDIDGGIELEVRTEVTDGVAVYRIVGRLDALTGPNLETAVGSAFSGENPRIIFDMGEVTFISSAGLRVILKTAKQAAAAKGGLAIFGLQSAVHEVFEVAGLQKFIPIASDEAEARSKLGA